jgi:hypothetical protein
MHMILITTAMVTAVQRQSSYEALADSRKSASSTVLNLDTVSESARIVIFKIFIFLIGLVTLMICTHDLIALTNTKETTRYCGSHAFGGKSALNTRFYRFNAS